MEIVVGFGNDYLINLFLKMEVAKQSKECLGTELTIFGNIRDQLSQLRTRNKASKDAKSLLKK